jgi:lipopolysaccharide transport system permease protein
MRPGGEIREESVKRLSRSGAREQLRLAVLDTRDAFRGHHAWVALAWMDIKHRYRRSVIGPFWITITMIVLIAGIGTLYGVLFGLPIREYLPYIALGDIVWIYISTAAQEGCGAFTASENMIRSLKLPFMTHIMRAVLRTFIVFLHGAVAYIPFIFILQLSPEWIWLMALPGVVLVAIMTVPLSMLLAVIATRFRDIQPSVANVMQLAFFLTPIIWKPDMLGQHRWVADINPFYHFIQVVRAPMMGEMPATLSYVYCVAFILALVAVAVPVFVLGRRKISVWV